MCTINYNVLAINIADYMPILIRTSGISTKAVKELFTLLRVNKTLKGEYHRALVNISSVKKKTVSGDAFAIRFHLKELMTDAGKVAELKLQSDQLLGTPIGLPEGREPEAFTPEGEPIYPEAEGHGIVAPKGLQPVESTPPQIDVDF